MAREKRAKSQKHAGNAGHSGRDSYLTGHGNKMGITRERWPDLQLKNIESGKTNGRNGKAGEWKQNLVLVDVSGAKSGRERRAAPSHVIEQGGKERAKEGHRDTHTTGWELTRESTRTTYTH